jgi:2-polyprenyl-6-methoxyphenol hydroxylase-like FAD-dependent oxidoreductase
MMHRPVFDSEQVKNITCKSKILDETKNYTYNREHECSNVNKAKFIIIGGGPGGMMTAILIKGKFGLNTSVDVYEKRDEYTRTQIVGLNFDSINLLKRMTSDGGSVLDDLLKNHSCYSYWPANNVYGRCYSGLNLSGSENGVPALADGGLQYLFLNISVCILEQILETIAITMGVNIIKPNKERTYYKIDMSEKGVLKIISVTISEGEEEEMQEVKKYDLTENLYVIGADGAQSTVRKAMAIGIELYDKKTTRTNNFQTRTIAKNSYAMIASFIPSSYSIENALPSHKRDRFFDWGEPPFHEKKFVRNNDKQISELIPKSGHHYVAPDLDPGVYLWRGFRSKQQNYYLGFLLPEKLYHNLNNVVKRKKTKTRKNQVYISMKDMDNETEKEIVRQFITKAAEFYNMNDLLDNENIEKLEFKLFETKGQIAETSYKKIGPSHFFLLGDSNFTVHFFTASGVNSAFIQAEALTNLLCKQKFSKPLGLIPGTLTWNVGWLFKDNDIIYENWNKYSRHLHIRTTRNDRLFNYEPIAYQNHLIVNQMKNDYFNNPLLEEEEERFTKACQGMGKNKGGLNLPEFRQALIKLHPKKRNFIEKKKRKELEEEFCK